MRLAGQIAMRNKRRIVLIAFCVPTIACVLGWVLVVSGEREPVYQGRSLSSWMSAFPMNWTEVSKPEKSAEQQLRAIEAITQMGTNTIPVFLRWLQARDGPMKEKLIVFIQGHPKIPYQPQSAAQKHQMAVRGLRILGPRAKPACESMVQIANASDAETKWMIMNLLKEVYLLDATRARLDTF